jgi:hypothetical protein
VTAPYIDIDPEAILIPQRLESSALGDDAPEEDVSRWHIIESKRKLTLCGLFVSQGSERCLLSKTPDGRRCETCIDRFGEEVVRDPDSPNQRH